MQRRDLSCEGISQKTHDKSRRYEVVPEESLVENTRGEITIAAIANNCDHNAARLGRRDA